MSTLVKRNQLIRTFLEARQLAIGFSTVGGINDNITAALGTLATADNVPVQVAIETTGSEVIGYVLNKQIAIWGNDSKSALTDGAGNEIYAKITKPAANYLLNYYSIVAGTETAYTMPASIIIDFAPIYFFNDLNLPIDALTRVTAIEVGEDPISRSIDFAELLTVSATNTLSALSNTPVSGSRFVLIINGITYDSTNGDVSTTGTTVNWLFDFAGGGFDITTSGYSVEAVYKIFA